MNKAFLTFSVFIVMVLVYSMTNMMENSSYAANVEVSKVILGLNK